MKRTIFIALLAVSSTPTIAQQTFSPPKTIVSIISDDHGYFDLAWRGNTNVTTPNLNQLFSSGIDLSHHYSFK